MDNPTIVTAVLGAIGIIVSTLITARVTKANNQASTFGTFLGQVLERLETVEEEWKSATAKVDNQADTIREIRDQNSILIDDQRRQKHITEELANYALALLIHIETGKPPPPPEVPWPLRPYFDQEST